VIIAAGERSNGAFTEGWYEYLADPSAAQNAIERGRSALVMPRE
jgi:hypothetical protein